MARVIAIDYGNWMAYVCTLNGADEITRAGGKMEDLIPSTYRAQGMDGIPNEYFWNMAVKDGKTVSNEHMGFMAARETNRPAENHLRLLKKHLGESVTLYGDTAKKYQQTFYYDDIIVKMFSYLIGLANDKLREDYGESGTTNLISLTYPAKLRDPAMLRYFVNLAEKADSGAKDKNGNMLKIKVVGAVCEPAAAGLDRLNMQRDNIKTDDVTYGVFDLGGGTFDLSIVTLFPKGRTSKSGKTKYYELVCDGKGLNLAGSDFSNRLRELMIAKAEDELGEAPTARQIRKIGENVERCKKELSDAEETIFYIETLDGDDIEVEVTRAEFENAIKSEVDRIIKFTEGFFAEHIRHRPDEIIMTGGSSYIPCIRRRLEAAFPAYKGKIHLHNPSKAAAYGAARFCTMDDIESPVERHVEFDLGTIANNSETSRNEMVTLIKAGTEIPCSSPVKSFIIHGQGHNYDIYSAKKQNPDHTNCPLVYESGNSEYRRLFEANMDVPWGTPTSCRLSIDENGLARLEAWQKDNESKRINVTYNYGKINNNSDDSND